MAILPLAIFALAAFVQGYTGFGFGSVSMAALSLMPRDLESSAAVITVIAPVLMILLWSMARRGSRIHWDKVLVLTATFAVGIPIGYRVLTVFREYSAFRGVWGVLILAFGINGLAAPRLLAPLRKLWGVVLGLIGGCISGAIVSGGPPVVLYLYSQTDDPRDMKATAQIVFIMSLLIRLATIVIIGGRGNMDRWATEGGLVLAGLPLAGAGVVAGHLLSRRASPVVFSKIVAGLLCLAGLVNITWAAIKATG